MKKKIRETTTRAVKKPKQKAITFASLNREIAKQYEIIEELNGDCLRHLRDAEKAEKELVNATGERDEYQRQFDKVADIIEFRLTTVFPTNHNKAAYDVYNNPIPQNEREMPEEQRVLGELLSMVRNVQLKRDYGDEMGLSPTRRGY